MGINNRGTGSSNKTFMNVYQSKIVLEYANEEDLQKKVESLGLDPSSIKVRQRTKGKNEGKDVFYYILNDISGLMTDITIKETAFGDFVEIELTDVDEKFVLSLGDVSSRIAKDFTRRVGNLDLSQEVEVGIWHISESEADNGKAKSGIKMYQSGVKVEYSISFDDMPEPIQKKGRKGGWDFSEQEDYLYDTLVKFKEDSFKPSNQIASKPSRPAPRVVTSEKDDLPF